MSKMITLMPRLRRARRTPDGFKLEDVSIERGTERKYLDVVLARLDHCYTHLIHSPVDLLHKRLWSSTGSTNGWRPRTIAVSNVLCTRRFSGTH
jgi:hypothetical protein